MKKILTHSCALIATFILMLFSQCTRTATDSESGRDYPTQETFLSIDSCMGYMASNPTLAHHMLDSLADAKLMIRQRCDYYHAIVVFNGENNLDSALNICDRLLEAGKFGDDRYLEEEICVLATNITSCNLRHVLTLEYAKRGIAICHGNEKMRDDEAQLMARVGMAEQALGRIEQARQTYDSTLKLLDPKLSFGDFIAFLSVKMKQVSLYSHVHDYDQVISSCQDIIRDVTDFERAPSIVGQRPVTMQKSSPTTHEFADFYRLQMYARIAKAYRMKIESGSSASPQAERDSVRYYLKRWKQVPGHDKPNMLANILPELRFAGMTDEFTAALPVVSELYRGDSIQAEYVEYLTLIAADADLRHDYPTTISYLRRALTVSDSIRQNDLARSLAEQMSVYKVQEHQLARQDAENQLARQKLIVALLSILLVVTILAAIIIIFLVRKNREEKQIVETTQQELTESKEEILELEQKLEETKIEKNNMSNQILYQRIEQVMREQQLYLDPELDIEKISDYACASRSVVSECINRVSGKPLRQWISEYRLALFEKLLKENPDASIDSLMKQCGYKDQSTFRRQFKAAYGMTVTEYRSTIQPLSENGEQPNIS